MSWKFWKRKKYYIEKTITEIPLNSLARWYFYDAGLEDPNVLAMSAGMIPVSDEGNQVEEDASDIRLSRIVPLVPFLETINEINARSITNLQFDHYVESGQIDPATLTDEKDHVEQMYRQVGYSALIAAFASALELGIISTDTMQGDISHE